MNVPAMKTHSIPHSHALAVAGAAALFFLHVSAGVRAAALSGVYEILASASTVNLTAEGTIDWAHWGRTQRDGF